MATSAGIVEGRDELGRYLPGAPGRKPGSRNKMALSLIEIRQRMVDSWKTCNGNDILRAVAKEKPLEYLKLIASLLPKVIEGEGIGAQIVIVVRNERELAFAERLQQVGEAGTLATPDVIDALLAAPCDVEFNGVTDGNGDNGNGPAQLPADDPAGD